MIQERENWEYMQESKDDELKAMEAKIANLIKEEGDTWKICEQRLIESIEEKSEIINDEILKE